MEQLNCRSNQILVIEDDEIIRALLVEFLTTEGYVVFQAIDGKDALNKLAIIPCPCLILLDLFMPTLDGFGFIEVLKKQYGDNVISFLPIVVVSAAPPEGEAAQKIKKQTLGFISKPFNLSRILKIVEQYCCPQAS